MPIQHGKPQFFVSWFGQIAPIRLEAVGIPAMSWPFGGMPHASTPPPPPMAACEETYGFFPCSTSLGGSIILIVVYGQALLIGQSTPCRWSPLQLTQQQCLAVDPERLRALTWLHLCYVRVRAREPLYVMLGICVCARLCMQGQT